MRAKPAASGAALGDGSLRDFRYFVSNVAHLAGGVFLNCGSAVILPEVFLKAVALVRNRGLSLDGLTTVNLDFIRHYRPMTNVVSRRHSRNTSAQPHSPHSIFAQWAQAMDDHGHAIIRNRQTLDLQQVPNY